MNSETNQVEAAWRFAAATLRQCADGSATQSDMESWIVDAEEALAALSHPAPDVPGAEEVEAIRARHEAMRGFVTAVPSVNDALLDRGTLLRLLDAAREELAEIREAGTVIVEGTQLSEYQSLSDSEGLSVWLCGPDCLEDLTFGDLRRLAAALAKDATT